MSLRHGLLGLLDQQPATGYQLAAAFGELGQWAWHASHSHIYPELRRMADEGLVEVVDTQSRGRKTYDITAAGRTELHRWMLEPSEDTVRSAAALRLFLVGCLEPEEARVFLQRQVDQAERQLAALRTQIERAGRAWQDNPLAVGRLAAERGLRVLPALRDWALWGLSQLSDEEGTPSG